MATKNNKKIKIKKNKTWPFKTVETKTKIFLGLNAIKDPSKWPNLTHGQ